MTADIIDFNGPIFAGKTAAEAEVILGRPLTTSDKLMLLARQEAHRLNLEFVPGLERVIGIVEATPAATPVEKIVRDDVLTTLRAMRFFLAQAAAEGVGAGMIGEPLHEQQRQRTMLMLNAVESAFPSLPT